VGLVLGVDGGNSKTDAVVATTDGDPVAFVRGGGSNSHGPGGSEACIEVIASLVDLDEQAERAVLFLCGADLPHDVSELTQHARARGWARDVTVDNDTFALLYAGTDSAEAVAVICGAGINCVGRNGDRIVRYPALGWETGDWGGAEMLGQEALYHANRAADGRGESTALVELVELHFGKPVVEVGADVHYKRLSRARLGELAPAVVASDDAIALELTQRLADEIVLLVERALRDLELADADVVLGGGMLAERGRLYGLVAEQLAGEPILPTLPPVAGAVLAALRLDAQERFRTAFADWTPRHG
jgi:N-acetylglucosamine kinase-like BadF-type ATPase